MDGCSWMMNIKYFENLMVLQASYFAFVFSMKGGKGDGGGGEGMQRTPEINPGFATRPTNGIHRD